MMMNKNQFNFSTTFANTKIKTYLGSSGAKAKTIFWINNIVNGYGIVFKIMEDMTKSCIEIVINFKIV